MNNKISIFGSSGFVGNHYLNMFLDNCIPIEREDDNPKSNDVLYFISTVHNYNIFENPYLDVNTNLLKLIKVLECFKNTTSNGVFNFISSWFVYGKNCTLNTKESDICDPTGFYSITKRAAEQMLICYCNTFNLNYRILRLTNIIGPGDVGCSVKKNAVQFMITELCHNKPIKVYDNGSNIRDFMDVTDACRAINVCIKKAPPNEIINISNRQPKSIGDIILNVKNKTQSTSNIEYISAPKFHKIVQVKDVCLNNDKLLSYGYTPSINTDESVENIIKSVRNTL